MSNAELATAKIRRAIKETHAELATDGAASAGELINRTAASIPQDSEAVCDVLEQMEACGDIYVVDGTVKLTETRTPAGGEDGA